MSAYRSRITIYDIAEELGISASTVTRALNNKTCISQSTRQAVQETAKRMGYRKNLLAQGLKSPQTKIGLILWNKFPEYQNLIASGARSACLSLHDYNASLEFKMLDVQDYDNRLLEQIEIFADQGFNGVIFTPCNMNHADNLNTVIHNKGIHASTLHHHLNVDEVDFCVGADYTRAGAMAADLLSMCGLKRGDLVAYLTGYGTTLPHHFENYQSFLRSSEQFGFDVRLMEHNDNPKIAYYLTEQILTELPNVKGIYCSTAVTVPVCEKLVEAGRSDDIVVIGTELLTDFVPYIENNVINASIFQNPFKLGYLSYRTLYECIAGNPPAKKEVRINPQIVIRGNVSYYAERITNIDPEN